MLKIISQCDIKHTMSLLIKVNKVRFEGLDIITSITARPIRLVAILMANVCLDVPNCRYSIFLAEFDILLSIFRIKGNVVDVSECKSKSLRI